MTKKEHEKIVRILQAKNQERHDKIVKELLAKREPMRISLDWKFSKVFWRFAVVCLLAIAFAVGNVWQFAIYRENTQTIRELENYAIIVRFTRANNGIILSDMNRILQDFQRTDTTALKLHVLEIIEDFESGESIIRQTRQQK